MSDASFRIPAKILLFGEYGLLTGGVGLVLTTDSHVFEVSFQLKSNTVPNRTQVVVDSAFFSSRTVTGILDEFKNSDEPVSFFLKALVPWQQNLNGFDLYIFVKKSFPPHFGFGSSSALLASLHLFLSQSFQIPFNSPTGWQRLRESLLAVQGRGSGYDVVVQTISGAQVPGGSRLWQVQWPENGLPVCTMVQLKAELPKWGVIIDSGVYSDTKKSLMKKMSEDFGPQQSSIANQVLTGTLEIKKAMQKSAQLSKQNGLHDEPEEFSRLLRYLSEQNLTFKTLGAGRGDAVWVLSNLNQLALQNPMTKQPLSQSVLFDFSKQIVGETL